MMNTKTIIISLIITATALGGCVIKPYKTPANLPVSEELYRTGSTQIDTSNNIALIPWREFFEDTTLNYLIDRVLKNNIDLKIAQKRIAQYYANLRMNRAAFAPSFSAKITGTHEGATGIMPSSSLKGLISASWEIDIWGKILSAKRSALADLMSSEDAHRALQTAIVAQVATSYFQLIFLDTERKIVLETIENRTKYLETTRSMKIASKVNEVAVQQAISQLNEVLGVLPEIDMAISQTENSIAVLCGDAPKHIERQTDVKISEVNFDQSIGYPAELLANRPDVRQAENKLRSSFELYNVARASLYPSLTISANGSTLPDLLNPTSLAFSALAGLTQPIFNGRKLRGQKEIAKLEAEATEMSFRQSILNAGMEVSNAIVSSQKSKLKAAKQAEQLVALKKAHEYSTELFIRGHHSVTYLDVLVAQTGVFNTQISLLTTYMNTIQAQIELYRALGGGWM